MKTLRIRRSLLEELPNGSEIGSLALFHDPLFDDYYIPMDTYWATWLLLKYPDLVQVDVDISLD